MALPLWQTSGLRLPWFERVTRSINVKTGGQSRAICRHDGRARDGGISICTWHGGITLIFVLFGSCRIDTRYIYWAWFCRGFPRLNGKLPCREISFITPLNAEDESFSAARSPFIQIHPPCGIGLDNGHASQYLLVSTVRALQHYIAWLE